jgi:hypothetical protein
MPVQRCVLEGRPGFKWGRRGKCYTYEPNNAAERERARRRAEEQGRAARVGFDEG